MNESNPMRKIFPNEPSLAKTAVKAALIYAPEVSLIPNNFANQLEFLP